MTCRARALPIRCRLADCVNRTSTRHIMRHRIARCNRSKAPGWQGQGLGASLGRRRLSAKGAGPPTGSLRLVLPRSITDRRCPAVAGSGPFGPPAPRAAGPPVRVPPRCAARPHCRPTPSDGARSLATGRRSVLPMPWVDAGKCTPRALRGGHMGVIQASRRQWNRLRRPPRGVPLQLPKLSPQVRAPLA